MSRIELQVSGMSCGHCQAGVTKALKAVPGVTDADVDLKSGKAVVQGDVDPRLLVEAVVEEGYEAKIAGA